MKGRVLAYLRDFGPKTHVAIANHVGDKPGEYGHLAAGSDVSEALAFLVTDGSVKPPYSNTKGNLMWEAERSEVTT